MARSVLVALCAERVPCRCLVLCTDKRVLLSWKFLCCCEMFYLNRRVHVMQAGTAIPLNGGAYNLLLNTTSKNVASLAACLTILSYTATAVVSAAECMTYASNLCPWIDVYWGTVLLLLVFCCLSILGITESAVVAVGIFVVHMGSMVFLILVGMLYGFQAGPPPLVLCICAACSTWHSLILCCRIRTSLPTT